MLPVNAEEAAEVRATVARGAVRHGDLIGWRGSSNDALKLSLVSTAIAIGAHTARWGQTDEKWNLVAEETYKNPLFEGKKRTGRNYHKIFEQIVVEISSKRGYDSGG